MKLCIHFEEFDRDVSSGTDHALHQWHELCLAFGVTELAVVNLSGEPVHAINDSLPVVEFETLDAFCEAHPKNYFLEQGGPDHIGVKIPDDGWLVIGASYGLPRSDLSIPVTAALYPREAAAIVLEAQWRST